MVVVVIAALFAVTATFLFGSINQELTPREDRAVVLMSVRTPVGVSLEYTTSKMREIEDSVEPLRQSGEITNVFAITGYGADNQGFMVATLAKWDERTRPQQEIADDIDDAISEIVGVRVFVIQPNSLGIRGAGRGLTFALTGTDYAQLSEIGESMVQSLRDDPRFGRVQLGYETTQPQLFVEIDRGLASDLGIDISGLGAALRAMLDGSAVADVFLGDTSFEVQMLSTSDPINDPGDLENVFVQAADGQMVPMASFVSLEERAVAPELNRESKNRSVEISASLTPELSLGQAMTEVEELASGLMSPVNRIVPLGEAAALEETSAGLLLTFGFAIAVVLLVLSAQFESFISAIVVMATVPLGLACAIFALIFAGLSLNVYSQIGLVMLIGIMAKNGILIVEFANQLRDDGAELFDAIYDASTIRLRPVMMTMTSTVLGGVPLILSSGAGAEAREALGWVVVGGLGLATVSTLFLTPVAYLLLARFSQPGTVEEQRLQRELTEAGSA